MALIGAGWWALRPTGPCLVIPPLRVGMLAGVPADFPFRTELPRGAGLFQVHPAGSATMERFYAEGAFHGWTADTAPLLCAPAEDVQCRVTETAEGTFAVQRLAPGYVMETDRSFMAAEVTLVDSGVMVRVFVEGDDMRAATCGMARALERIGAEHLPGLAG